MSKAPMAADVLVGARMRLRRKELRLSQGELGEKLGVTFQQIQKYENGTNRVGASRLEALARALDVPVGYFFDEQRDASGAGPPTALHVMREPGAMELLTAYGQIGDASVRRALVTLARNLVCQQQDAASPARVQLG